jgi:CRP-like cAMP-binding protein
VPALSGPNSPKEPKNQLLELLPNGEHERLRSSMDQIPLSPHDVIQRPGQSLRYVYFPLRGVISLMTAMQDGTAVETATVGNEGMVGVHALLGGGAIGNLQAIGQVPGETLRMGADHFRAEVDAEDGKLREVLFAYMQALFVQISQGVACNGVHPIQQRCARWLLESHDRAGSDEVHLTQEFLSDMLGVRRASVTVAARTLQAAGLIEYGRGQITVIDRAGLEEASCECYSVIKQEYRRLVTR